MPVLDPERDAETVAAIYPKAEIKEPPLDLSGDNELGGMLTTRATLQRLIKDAREANQQARNQRQGQARPA